MSFVNPLVLSLAFFASFPQETRISDQFRCTLAPSLVELLQADEEAPPEFRLILELRPRHGGYGGGEIERRILVNSTPIASWNGHQSVELDPESRSLVLTNPDRSYPEDWHGLEGLFEVRPMLLIEVEPGRPPLLVRGPEKQISLRAGNQDVIELELDELPTEDPGTEPPRAGVMEISIESPLISEHAGGIRSEDRMHRAHVVVPKDYHDFNASRRRWPVVYVVPGRADPGTFAEAISRLANEPAMQKILPQVIWVVLDPRTDHGHHYFMDSALHGPRSQALVEEFIPWIDVRLRTIPRGDARILLGEEQGGCSVLHLLVEHEEVFSDAWAISPEAVSLASLGKIDLYEDANAYEQADGKSNPALRSPLGPERDLVHLDVRGEVMRAQARGWNGNSGERWLELCAVFGGRPETPIEQWWPFDPATGAVKPIRVSRWMKKDLARKARMNPEIARRLHEHARILIGDRDEYYRNLGTRSLEIVIEEVLAPDPEAPMDLDWIDEIESASSLEVGMISNMRRNEQIIEALKQRGHHD